MALFIKEVTISKIFNEFKFSNLALQKLDDLVNCSIINNFRPIQFNFLKEISNKLIKFNKK